MPELKSESAASTFPTGACQYGNDSVKACGHNSWNASFASIYTIMLMVIGL